MSKIINIPILCSKENYNETCAELGIPQENAEEYRMGFVQKSTVVMFYPTNSGLINIELLNGLNCITNVPIKELLNLLEE